MGFQYGGGNLCVTIEELGAGWRCKLGASYQVLDVIGDIIRRELLDRWPQCDFDFDLLDCFINFDVSLYVTILISVTNVKCCCDFRKSPFLTCGVVKVTCTVLLFLNTLTALNLISTAKFLFTRWRWWQIVRLFASLVPCLRYTFIKTFVKLNLVIIILLKKLHFETLKSIFNLVTMSKINTHCILL